MILLDLDLNLKLQVVALKERELYFSLNNFNISKADFTIILVDDWKDDFIKDHNKLDPIGLIITRFSWKHLRGWLTLISNI